MPQNTAAAPSRPQVTQEAYDPLTRAYAHFNAALFDDELPGALITLQRNKRFFGYFSSNRFVNETSNERADEIAMNPASFAVRPIEAILSTLVHEQVHQWQARFGDPGRRGYHNREWADKMKAIGLQPSSTGRPGGKEVGERMSHFIVPGGPFMRAVRELLDTDFRLGWIDRYPMADDLPAYVPTDDDLRDLYPDDYPSEDKGNTQQDDLPTAASSNHVQNNPPGGGTAGTAGRPQAAAAPDSSSAPGAASLNPASSTTPAQEPQRPVAPSTNARLSTTPVASGLDVELPTTTNRTRAKTTRAKFLCPSCSAAAWGKPSLHLVCGECDERFARVDQPDEAQ